MKFLIVSNAPIIYLENKAFAYSPYVKELIVWEKNVDVSFCCPAWETDRGLLIDEITFRIEKHYRLVDNDLKSLRAILKSFIFNFYNFFVLFKAMREADHIHLRCPGNVGLVGCIVQIFFPGKIKTAKYAGNWDPESKQPLTYRMQKYILNNAFLTKNMTALVYGDWQNQSINIKSFFTATYSENEKESIHKSDLKILTKFIFVGSLVSGKNTLYAIKMVEELIKNGKKVILDIYGDGVERKNLENYIETNDLIRNVVLHGNQNKEVVKKAYKNSHFVILASKSEGWPKAIAEGMFWGCVPLSTKVSCVPFMLDYGNRGILLEMDLKKDITNVECIIKNEDDFFVKSKLASEWSRQYTIEVFESEIKKLLQ